MKNDQKENQMTLKKRKNKSPYNFIGIEMISVQKIKKKKDYIWIE